MLILQRCYAHHEDVQEAPAAVDFTVVFEPKAMTAHESANKIYEIESRCTHMPCALSSEGGF